VKPYAKPELLSYKDKERERSYEQKLALNHYHLIKILPY
jgi:hypothetical protein